MQDSGGGLARVREFVHHHFLWLLVGAYLLAAAGPAVGEAIRHATVLTAAGLSVSVPLLLLAGLLFNAGLAAAPRDLLGVVRAPRAVLAGVAATVVVPLGCLALLALGLRGWHDPDEVRCLVVGLGVVAAMPVAGSSTAWSQNAGGSAALSLGLVAGSTLLSPLTTPLALAAVGPLTGGGLPETAGLAGPGTVALLLVGVAGPSAAGMAARGVLGPGAVARLRPGLKLANAVAILVLCYANASSALPAVAAEPDWDYLALAVAAATLLCAAGFGAGWVVARVAGAGGPQRRSLVFALGMSNNGTGLVLAGAALGGVPAAVLPVLAYNLIQHLTAGVVYRSLGPPAGGTE